MIAAYLAVGAAIDATASAVSAILLLPVYPVKATLVALQFGAGVTFVSQLAGRPTVQPEPGTAQRVALDAAELYRAAYVMNAARRTQQRIDAGMTPLQAVQAERRTTQAHMEAQGRRFEMANRVDHQAILTGPLIGWYSTLDSRTTPECKAAHGRNFKLDEPPRIGYPGSVHMRCRCKPGPPHRTTRLVDRAREVKKQPRGFESRVA